MISLLCGPAALRFGVRNLRIDEETTFSLQVSWQPVDSRHVRHYRLSYISVGDGAEETVRQWKRGTDSVRSFGVKVDQIGDILSYYKVFLSSSAELCKFINLEGVYFYFRIYFNFVIFRR